VEPRRYRQGVERTAWHKFLAAMSQVNSSAGKSVDVRKPEIGGVKDSGIRPRVLPDNLQLDLAPNSDLVQPEHPSNTIEAAVSEETASISGSVSV
jgi:hypothetical protein